MDADGRGTAPERPPTRTRRDIPTLPLVATVLTFAVGFAQKWPCHYAGWPWDTRLAFGSYCYSDIPILFRGRGLIDGAFPYAPQPAGPPLEYPVGSGYLMDLTARLSRLFTPGADEATAAQAYFLVNVVVLLALALLTVWAVHAVLRRTGGRTRDALLVAAAPTLALAGTINWDLLAVAAAVLAVLAWAYDRPLLAGAMIGLGTAAKLFPLFLLGPLLLLCLRDRRLRDFARTLAAAVAVWLVLNAPVMVLYPDGWWEFWRFNAAREADFGALWYALQLLGAPVPAVNEVALGVLVLLLLGVAALARYARRPPTLAQLGFLTVAAFLLTNKVYSPQYVLWLLPLLVLARGHAPGRRVLRDWALWQAAEVLHWVAVWRYLGEALTADWQYPAAILIRVAVTAYLCGQVVRDVLTAPAEAPAGARPAPVPAPAPQPA